MKQFTQVNNSKGLISRFLGLKSRISSINHRIWSVIAPMLLIAFGLFGVNVKAWGYSSTKLIVNISGHGQIKLNSSSSAPSSWSSTSLNLEQGPHGFLETGKTDTYYIWVNPNTGYHFVNFTGDLTPSWNSSGYYTAAFKGATLVKNATKTVTANFAANSYTISFEGNGNTSGSMDNQSGFVYGTAKTLNANAFGRAYTVTYDANGGTCGTSSATATYSFNGWKSSDNTSYDNQASISTFSPAPTTNGATVTLTAQWTSASVTLPSATKDGAVLDGWYSGNTKIGDPGDAYTPTANITLTAKWISKYDFEITGDNYTINNEAWNKTGAFTFVHADEDEDHMTTTIQNPDVISYDRASNTITAKKIGTSKITFTQNTSATVNNGTIEYTITVDSVVNNLAVSATSFTKYVDQEVTSVRSNQNSDGEITTTSSNHNLAHYDISNNKIVIPNSDAQNLPFDNVTITISQAATAKYKAKKHTITLTVNKYANALTCSWGAKPWYKNVNFDSHTAVTFASTNTEAGAPAITVDKVSGGAVADYNSSTKKIDANHRDGTVIWEVEQVENYKYVRALEKCTVNVGTVAAPDCDVLLYSSDPDKEASKISAITLNGLGVAMTFDIKYKGAGGTVKVKRTYNNGSSDETEYTATAFAGYTNRSITLGANVSKVEFVKKGTDDPYINTIRVTRKKYFDIENKAGSAITEMTMPQNIRGGVVKRDTFYVDYSTCEGTIKLENHHPRIKFAATNSNTYSFSTGTAHYGRPTIALTYTSPDNDAENITDTIYIYTPSDHKKLIVHAQSKGKLQTTLHYIGKASYSADTTNIASMALFEVRDENNDLVANPIITLGTGTTSNVTLANDNKSIASLCGNSNDGTTGNVTASYAGDGTYEAATNNGLSQNFTINRLKDEVSFDSGYESMVVGEEIDLTEWATSCTSGSDITVTSVFKDYIVIEDGKVKAVAKGDGRLRAASAGNCTYNSGVKFLNISVRNADDPCGSAVMYSSKLIKVGAYSHTSSNPVTYTIPDGPQDKLTFKVWKVPAATQEATLQILDKNENVLPNGTIDYGAGSLSGSEPDAPNKEINMADYPGAKKLRFYGGGTLNKYFSEVRISQKSYLTASTSSVTMSTVKACETAEGQFTVDYSDVSHIQLSQTNNDFSYEVWDGETKLVGFNNDCKQYGTYTVKFFYTPQAKGPYSNTVTLTASGKQQVITLSGTANAPEREIVWDLDLANEISATQSLDLTAYAQTSCENPAGSVYYTWSSSTDNAATIEGSHITFNKEATVTVTASTVTSNMYEDATSVSKVWTVGKVGTQMRTLPTITSTITYGDNSSVVSWDKKSWEAEDVLNNEKVEGSISYVGPDSFTTAGATNLTFNFTPNNVSAYEVCQFTVPVTVQKKASEATPSVAAHLTYGQQVKEAILTNSGTAGTWAWKEADREKVLGAGSHTLNVDFTPTNSNYTTISNVAVTLIVDQASQTITWDPATNISTIDQILLNGTTNGQENDVMNTITYTVTNNNDVISVTNNVVTILKPGTVTITASQNGSANYAAATPVVKNFTISAESLTLTAPTAQNITYGQALSASELTGGSAKDSKNNTVDGTFAWQTATTVLNAGDNQTPTVVFTPSTNAVWYTDLTTTATIDVAKANLAATVENVSFAYGTKAEDVALSGTGAGTWTWTDSRKGQVLAVDTYEMDVHFAPTDDANYHAIDKKITLTVTKADPAATVENVSFAYGTKAEDVMLVGTGEGTWSWTDSRKDQVLTVGEYEMDVQFAPTDGDNYNAIDTKITLTVNKATPAVTPQATAIDQGQTVSQSTLSTKTGSVPGTWSWKNEDANTKPNQGNYVLLVNFTPDDADNYNSLTNVQVSLTVNAPSTYVFTGEGDWTTDENWNASSDPAEPVDVIVSGNVVISTEVTVKSLTVEEGQSVTITSTGKLTLGDESSEDRTHYGDLYVHNGGKVVLGEGTLQVNDFKLDAKLGNSTNAAASGQVDGSDKLNVNGDAFFQMTFDPNGAITYGWYDFTVPFEVEVLNGIYDANGNKLTNGVDYLVMNYSEAKRAVRGKDWNMFSGTMQPGQIYSITLDASKNWNTFLFKRKANSDVLSDGSYAAEFTPTGAEADHGWNGFGNGTLQHMQLKGVADQVKIQLYNHSENRYEAFDANEKAFAVGTAFFMQVKQANQTIEMETSSKALRAPSYAGKTTEEFRLSLTADNDEVAADRLWISAAEDATTEYTIGHDLVKMGTPTQSKVAQMWMPAGELRLCDIEMPLVNNNASTALSIYAPKAGTYTLAVERAPENAILFLTKNGRVMWNLSQSGYLLDLSKGTTEEYGLCLVYSAPQVATGVDEVVSSVKGQKVIIDNKIYIITNTGDIYDATGKKVN